MPQNPLDRLTTMSTQPLLTDADYRGALREIETLMAAAPGSPKGEHLEELVSLVEAYEQRHFALDGPGPVSANADASPALDTDALKGRHLSPASGRSLRGILERPHQPHVPPEEWDRARDEAWAAAAREAEETEEVECDGETLGAEMRTTITLPEELYLEVRELAGSRSFSAFAAEAIRLYVLELRKQQLAREMEAGYQAEAESPSLDAQWFVLDGDTP